MKPNKPLWSAAACAAASCVLISCASASGANGGLAPRENGCAIELMREGVPTQSVRLISNVRARCTGDIAADRARCERLLMDEGCRRGAVVLWQLRESPLRDTEDGIQLEAAAGVYR